MQYLLTEPEYEQLKETISLKTIANMALEAEVEILKKKISEQEAQIREMHRDAEGSAKALADARAQIEALKHVVSTLWDGSQVSNACPGGIKNIPPKH